MVENKCYCQALRSDVGKKKTIFVPVIRKPYAEWRRREPPSYGRFPPAPAAAAPAPRSLSSIPSPKVDHQTKPRPLLLFFLRMQLFDYNDWESNSFNSMSFSNVIQLLNYVFHLGM
jgi:hypothetical protein